MTKAKLAIGVNTTLRVYLSQEGRCQLAAFEQELLAGTPPAVTQRVTESLSKIAPDGREPTLRLYRLGQDNSMTMPLWEFMMVFGPRMHFSMPNSYFDRIEVENNIYDETPV